MCDVKFLVYVAAFHIALSALHYFLEWLHPRTKSTWDDKAAKIVDYLLTTVEWIMGNRKRK